MKKIRLGLDCDGVVYNFVDSLRTWIAASTGRPLEEMVDANTWNFFKDQWGYTTTEYKAHILAGIDAGHIFKLGEPMPGVVETINRLYKDYEIIFITSRSGYGEKPEACKQHTLDWLWSYGIPFDGLIMAEDKTRRGVDLLLEDAPHQIERACEAGEHVVVFDQLWNQHLDLDIPRVKSWQEFEGYIQKVYAYV